MLSHITLYDNNTAYVEFASYPLSGDEIIFGTPRAIDSEIFTNVWEQWEKTSNPGRINRALSWFSKGLGEEPYIDKFVSYWVSIEALTSILRRQLQQKIRNPDEWDGVKAIFAQLGNSPTFNEVYEARNQLLHGYEDINPDFIKKITSYVPVTRNVAILSISKVLDIKPSAMEQIMALQSLRLLKDFSVETRGTITNLPVNFSDLLQDMPELQGRINYINYALDASGKLNSDINFSQVAHLPSKSVFHAIDGGIRGHDEAGIKGVKSGGYV